MLLTIHDASLRKVAFIDNDKQATLNYFNDTWTRYLETGSSTFDFTVFKKAIISDVGRKRAYNYLNEKAFVSFQYKGKTYLHTIRKIEENEQVIKCYGINLNLELINEYANPYKAPKAMTFKEYCDAMDLLNFTFLKIGVNEISTQKISAEWDGTDTKLNRLLSLAKKFGAEIEFDTYLNADSSIKSFVVNVYHENDDTHQGVGRISPTVLTYGKNLKTLTRTVDKTNIYNMVRPTGRTDNGDIVTISGLSAWSVNNAKGEREFYQAGEGLYAPLSMQMYPSVFTSSTTNDQWIRKDMQVESANPEVIRSAAYRELKKNCYPAVTYEAEGFADLEIGDTVKVYDDGFNPVLLLEMRVSEQTISFTNPKNNKTTFSNAKALENLLSNGIQERLDRMIEDAKPYTVKVSTNNGTAFKNGLGSSLITPTLKRGTEVISGASFAWYVNGALSKTGDTFEVLASTVEGTTVIKVEAIIRGQVVASTEVTFTNVDDGKEGATVQSISTMNKLSDTAVVSKTGSFSTNMPNPTKEAPYVVSYLKTTLTDGTVVESDAFISETWNDSYVGKSEISVTPEGIVTSASKTVNGQTIASMIAQRAEWVEIIAQFLKIKADMIVDGAITADKLNVAMLSALTSNLGTVTAGNLLLQRSFKAGSSVIPAYKYPDYKTGLFVDNHGLLVNGMPVQKTSSETMASDMPIVAMTAGEVRFSRVDITENLERLLHEGLSDQDFGSIQFGRDPDGRNALVIQVNGQVYLKGQNYTDWTVSTWNRNVRWKVQGNLVIVDYDVTFSSSGNQAIVIVPTTYVPKALMLTAKTWMDDNTKDRNAQLNADGGLHILGAEANRRYCGQIVWAY